MRPTGVLTFHQGDAIPKAALNSLFDAFTRVIEDLLNGPPRETMPVSDCGIEGAVPLPPSEWLPATLTDQEWAAQNRKINDFLAGRQTA